MAKIKDVLISAIVGAVLCGGVVFIIARGANNRLETELTSALNHSRELGKSLADAIAASEESAATIKRLSQQLVVAGKLSSDQQQKLNLATQRSIEQQRIIDGILSSIAGAGADFDEQLKSFAEGFERLYSYYHPTGQ